MAQKLLQLLTWHNKMAVKAKQTAITKTVSFHGEDGNQQIILHAWVLGNTLFYEDNPKKESDII